LLEVTHHLFLILLVVKSSWPHSSIR